MEMKIFYRVLLSRFVLIIFLESIQCMTKELYRIIISDTRICQLKSMILIYYYRVLENSISKVSPTIATFIKKACTFHADILFLQLLPYNRKEKGGGRENQSLPPPLSFPSHMKLRITGAVSLRVPSLSLSEMTFGYHAWRGRKKSEDKALSSSVAIYQRQLPTRPYASFHRYLARYLLQILQLFPRIQTFQRLF